MKSILCAVLFTFVHAAVHVKETVAGVAASPLVPVAADNATDATDDVDEAPKWFKAEIRLLKSEQTAAMANLTAAVTNLTARVTDLTARVTDLTAGMWTPDAARRIEHCARESTVWLVCDQEINGTRSLCSGAMVQHGANWVVVTSGHCSCAEGSWQASSLELHAEGSLLPRTCSVLHNFYSSASVNDPLDGMVLDCGRPEGLVRPLRLPAAALPLTQEALVYTGFSNGAAAPDRRISLAALRAHAYLHTVFAQASASFADGDVGSASGWIQLANGSLGEVTDHDAFTAPPGLSPQQGMSGGPLMSRSCELVGIARGSGKKNSQGVYVPAHKLFQLIDQLFYPPFDCPVGGGEYTTILLVRGSERGTSRATGAWDLQPNADLVRRCISRNINLSIGEAHLAPLPLASAEEAVATARVQFADGSEAVVFMAPGESAEDAVLGFRERAGIAFTQQETQQLIKLLQSATPRPTPLP